MTKPKKTKRNGNPDRAVEKIVAKYTAAATVAMVAVPVPGADFLATFAIWGAMIREIAAAYDFKVTKRDAQKLAGELFEGVVVTTLAWFGSAKLASGVLKFIPGAGTVTAYLVDACIAAFGAGTVTATIGTAAATFYKSGKKAKMKDIRSVAAKVAKEKLPIAQALKSVAPSEEAELPKKRGKKTARPPSE